MVPLWIHYDAMDKALRSVVVTGASTGIGEATARVLAGAGMRVFGSVRRIEDGERLAREIGANFIPVVFDVTDTSAIAQGAAQVDEALGTDRLFGLVNNAGMAVLGPLLLLDPNEFRRQLDVNLTGQLVVTQAFAPMLGTDRSRTGAPGRIVMMSSVGGRNASPFMGPYNTSKFGLEGFSESLRRELMIFGIDVIIIAPGAIATPIWDKADALDVAPFENTPYFEPLTIAKQAIAIGRKGFPPDTIGRAVLHALTSPRPKTRYVITPTPLQEFLVRWLPKRVLDRIVAKRLGIR
jgi:NAD(P)-dependent dehydrogenase (short-subunit alcohol dehydrogenase family)